MEKSDDQLDRQQQELSLIFKAAKASGKKISHGKTGAKEGWSVLFVYDLKGFPGQSAWLPLASSEHALELAIDLNMDIEVNRQLGSVWAGASAHEHQALEKLPDDATKEQWHAATRRAIVRAAASFVDPSVGDGQGFGK